MSKRSVRRGAERRAMKEQRRAGRRTVGLAFGVGAAAAGMSLVPVSAAQAVSGPIVVTNTSDLANVTGSLRAAIILANQNPDADTITFDSSVTGTITVDAAMDITESLSIVGPGAGRLTLDGGDDDRIFTITGTGVDEATVISGLTLTRGQAVPGNLRPHGTGTRPHTKGTARRAIVNDSGYGGAIYSGNGGLTLQNVIMTDNESTAGAGGAVYETGGDLTVIGSTFDGNTAYYDGGAISVHEASLVTITGSTFTDNSGDDGGAIYNHYAVETVITGSTFNGNHARTVNGYGGALYQAGGEGVLTMTSTEVSNNTATTGGGVYVNTDGPVIIDRSFIHDNQAGTYGGGLLADITGDFTLSDSVVSGNDSQDEGGGVEIYGAASAKITGSTIADNTSVSEGGGLLLGGDGALTFPVDVVNTTISGNEATDEGIGSGVYAYEVDAGAGRLTFTHSTIAGNTGDGLTSEDGDVTLQGSIVADNTVVDLSLSPPRRSSTSSARRAPGQFSLDYSLVEKPGDGLTQEVTAGSNLLGVDPQLGALAANGGPTPTMLPAATSPVLDKAKAFSATTDQRGLVRPSDFTGIANAAGGDASDMGAVELQAPKPPTPPALVSGSCDGAVATIVAKPGVPTVGTPGRDVIVGTAGADSISGGGGDDLICGLGGDDAIDTGAGRNRVFGGDGNDLIRGGASRDVLFGDAGDDRIYGGRANDTIDGGAGNDTVRGNRGNDKIKGGGGKDSLRGGKNRDTLTGGPGKDKVRGGQAKDKVTQ